MKWFKHMTDMLDDVFVDELISKFGPEGYGIWCAILETYGKYEKGNVGEFVEIPVQSLTKRLRVSRGKVEKILNFSAEKSKLFANFLPTFFEIKIVKMKELCDEHTSRKIKNSGVTPSKNKTKDLDKDKEIKKASSEASKKTDEDDVFSEPKEPENWPKQQLFSIKRNGNVSSEMDWLRTNLHQHLKLKDLGLSVHEMLQLYPQTQKTFNRWMAHAPPVRMASFLKTMKTNAKNELTYALALAEKSEYDLNVLSEYLKDCEEAVNNQDYEVEFSG